MALMVCAVLASDEETSLNFDWQPPAFSAKTIAGNDFNYPADLEGNSIVLFWATWCPFCKALMPHLQSIVDEYNYEIPVIALNFIEDDDPDEFLRRYGFQFLLIPEADQVAESWGIKGTPGLYLVDETGRAVFSLRAIPESAFRKEEIASTEELKRYQKAARRAPIWAAQLRKAIDELE